MGDRNTGFFVGLNKSTAAKMTPDTEFLFAILHKTAFKMPKKDDILSFIILEDLKASVERDVVPYRARNFIPISHFLMQVVVSSIPVNQGKVAKVLLEVVFTI